MIYHNTCYARCCRGTVPVCCIPGPTGATGPIGPPGATGPQGIPGTTTSGLSAYGGIYNATSQLVFFTQLDQFEQIRFNSTLPALNITYPANNSLVIQIPGDYKITYNILLNTSNAVTVSIVARQNGLPIAQTRGVQTLSFDEVEVLSFDGRLSCATLATLAAGDVIDLAIAVVNTLPPNLDAVINGAANATLAVEKLDEI